MKILAIIPACEGSRMFPNKNIRIVNGKPLIYYVIQNAKQSKYIDDVIVTTNSTEIINIANYLGVMTRLRRDSLCNSDTSLDVVIDDVFNQIDKDEYDYVVTMQSIAPTLRVETLDAALKDCINANYDTVISVCSDKKYLWRKSANLSIPLQVRNENRNCLEPFYVETGGFFITKTEFISSKGRLGNRVHLYELSSEEAVDVHCFGDLKQVESILCHKNVAIYVNGNNMLGLGHIYRVIQLADELFTKPDIYYDFNQTERSSFGKTTYNLIPVDGDKGLFHNLREKKYDIFINDILSTEYEYMKMLRELLPNGKIVNFEDEGNGAIFADKVFNALYEVESAENICAGEKYFIASKLFLLYQPIKIKENVKNVFVCFGGADPQDYTGRILKIIQSEGYLEMTFWIVVGKANVHMEKLSLYDRYPNIHVLYDVDNIAELMSKCDIAVTSRGRTGFELVFMGVPTISIAQNKRESLHSFLSMKNGVEYLGINPSDEQIANSLNRYIYMEQEERQCLQDRMLKKDLRNGRKNVMSVIQNL